MDAGQPALGLPRSDGALSPELAAASGRAAPFPADLELQDFVRVWQGEESWFTRALDALRGEGRHAGAVRKAKAPPAGGSR